MTSSPTTRRPLLSALCALVALAAGWLPAAAHATAPLAIAAPAGDYGRTQTFNVPGAPNLTSFSAEFSTDGGTTWQPLQVVSYQDGALIGDLPGAVADGTIRLRAQINDGAQTADVGYATPATVVLDTTAPTGGSALALTGDQTRNANALTLGWTTPAGQRAPIAAVHYKLCEQGNPFACTTDTRALAPGQASLSGVAVPAEGAYTAQVWLEDAAGNVDASDPSNTVTLTYDSTAPAGGSALALTADQAAKNTNSFSVSWTTPLGQLAPIAAAHYAICPATGTGACATGTQALAVGQRSLSGLSVPAGDGRYNVTVYLEDAAGNANAAAPSNAAAVTYDTTSPMARLQRDSSDYGSTVNFVDVADTLTGVDATTVAAQVSPDGTTWTPLSSTNYDAAAQTFTGTVSGSIPSGYVRVRLQASDAVGNTRRIGDDDRPLWINVDRTLPPGGADLQVTATQQTAKERFTLSWPAPANQAAAITTAITTLCPAGQSSGCTTNTVALSGANQADVVAPAEGRYTATVALLNSNGTTGPASKPVTLTYDVTAPTGTLDRAQSSYSRTVRFTGISDAVSGVTAGGLTGDVSADDGATWTALDAPSFDASTGTYRAKVPAAIADGAVRVRVTAVDGEGNRHIDDETINVDTTAPTGGDALALTAAAPQRNVNDFTLTFRPPTGQVAPLRRARINVCPTATGSACTATTMVLATGQDRLEHVTVPGDGDYRASVYLEDAAGNSDPAQATTVNLRLDSTGPQLAPRAVDLATLRADISDALAGVRSCVISVRFSGDNVWRDLPSLLTDGVCAAAVPHDLRAGQWNIRVTASDQLGNVSSTDQIAGTPWRMVKPGADHPQDAATDSDGTTLARSGAGMRAGGCTAVRQAGAVCATRTHSAKVALPSRGLSYVGIELRDASGQPIRGAVVRVDIKPDKGRPTVDWRTSSADGAVTVSIGSTTKKATLRFRYAGSARYGGTAMWLKVTRPVRAASRTAKSRKRAAQPKAHARAHTRR